MEDADSKDRAEVFTLRPNWSRKQTRLGSSDLERERVSELPQWARWAPWDEKLSRSSPWQWARVNPAKLWDSSTNVLTPPSF